MKYDSKYSCCISQSIISGGKKKLFQVWSESLNVTGSLVEDILHRPTGGAFVSRENRSGIWLAAG